MRDKQVATFLQGWSGFTRGVISSHKPNQQTSLSAILQQSPVPERFYLSPKACVGILRRAGLRGKTLPEPLAHALRQAAGLAPTLNATEDLSPTRCAPKAMTPARTERGEEYL